MSYPLIKSFSLLRNSLGSRAAFSSSSITLLNQTWREKKKLPSNLNKDHQLLELPDYSYFDGRPTPYGTRQKRRIEQQKQYTAKIIELTKEIDLAENLYRDREAAKEAKVKERLSRKLTPKGSHSL